MALYFDGQIRLSWSQVRALKPFVGVSSGRPPSRHSLRLETLGEAHFVAKKRVEERLSVAEELGLA